jgi:hypothetical protein
LGPTPAGDDLRRHETTDWRIALPIGVTGGPVGNLTNPEVTTMAIYRGWVEDEPLSVIVSTRPRTGTTLRRACRRLGTDFHQPPGDGRAVVISGAHRARRIDGLMDLDEGLGEPPRWTERLTLVVAAARHELVTLTVRRRPDADLTDVVERIVDSFALIS